WKTTYREKGRTRPAVQVRRMKCVLYGSSPATDCVVPLLSKHLAPEYAPMRPGVCSLDVRDSFGLPTYPRQAPADPLLRPNACRSTRRLGRIARGGTRCISQGSGHPAHRVVRYSSTAPRCKETQESPSFRRRTRCSCP